MATVPFLAALRGLWLSNDSSLYVRGAGITEGLATPLALVGLALVPLCRDRRALIYLAVARLSILLAAGPGNAVYDVAAALVPGVDRLRQTFHFVWVAGPPLAVGRAVIVAGADARRASTIARAATIVTAVAVAWLGVSSLAGLSLAPVKAGTALFLLSTILVATAWRMWALGSRWAPWAIASAVTVKAVVLAPGYNAFPGPDVLSGPSQMATVISRRPPETHGARVMSFPMPLHRVQPRRILFRHRLDAPALQAMGYRDSVLCPSLQLLYGVSPADGFHTAPLGRRALVQPILERKLRGESPLAPGDRLPDRFDVRFVTVADTELPAAFARDLEPAPDFGHEGARVFENRYASGQRQLVSEVVVVPDEASALRALEAGESRIVVEERPAPDWPIALREAIAALPWTSEHVHVRAPVVPNGPGWLFVPTPVFPGWRARVDGQPAPIHAADVAGTAIPVDAGAREVELSFLPIGFHIGALMSAATLVGIAGIVALRAWRRAG